MKQINLYKAKTELSSLVDKASKGESFVIAKSGIPLAKLVPLHEEKKKKIKFGTMKGEFVVPDDFDDPLPKEILDAFEGKSD
jgi:prevent-host-death family protein